MSLKDLDYKIVDPKLQQEFLKKISTVNKQYHDNPLLPNIQQETAEEFFKQYGIAYTNKVQPVAGGGPLKPVTDLANKIITPVEQFTKSLAGGVKDVVAQRTDLAPSAADVPGTTPENLGRAAGKALGVVPVYAGAVVEAGKMLAQSMIEGAKRAGPFTAAGINDMIVRPAWHALGIESETAVEALIRKGIVPPDYTQEQYINDAMMGVMGYLTGKGIVQKGAQSVKRITTPMQPEIVGETTTTRQYAGGPGLTQELAQNVGQTAEQKAAVLKNYGLSPEATAAEIRAASKLEPGSIITKEVPVTQYKTAPNPTYNPLEQALQKYYNRKQPIVSDIKIGESTPTKTIFSRGAIETKGVQAERLKEYHRAQLRAEEATQKAAAAEKAVKEAPIKSAVDPKIKDLAKEIERLQNEAVKANEERIAAIEAERQTKNNLITQYEENNKKLFKQIQESSEFSKILEETLRHTEALRSGAELPTVDIYSKNGTWDPARETNVHVPYINKYDLPTALPAAGQAPEAVLMVGGTASGKSTVAKRIGLDNNPNYVYVNADDAKMFIPEFKRARGTNAGQVHEESSVMAKTLLAKGVSDGKNIVYDATLKDPAKTNGIVRALKDKGYNVKVVFIDTPEHIAVSNAYDRFKKGHNSIYRYVEESIVRESNRGARDNFLNNIKNNPDVDSWKHFYGVNEDPALNGQLIEEGSNARPITEEPAPAEAIPGADAGIGLPGRSGVRGPAEPGSGAGQLPAELIPESAPAAAEPAQNLIPAQAAPVAPAAAEPTQGQFMKAQAQAIQNAVDDLGMTEEGITDLVSSQAKDGKLIGEIVRGGLARSKDEKAITKAVEAYIKSLDKATVDTRLVGELIKGELAQGRDATAVAEVIQKYISAVENVAKKEESNIAPPRAEQPTPEPIPPTTEAKAQPAPAVQAPEGKTEVIPAPKQPKVEQPKAAGPAGDITEAITERGTKIEARYKVVDAKDLIASHDTNLKANPDYPKEIQPRDRSRAASQLQIENIAKNLEPKLLGKNVKASEGAPVVGKDMVVESGNARTIAIRMAYDEFPEKAGEYKAWLVDHADKFGIDPTAIENIENPVLVRERITDIDRATFAKEANEGAVASMSATETAVSDSEKLTDGMMDSFVVDENGSILTGANLPFIRSFMDKVVGPTERAQYQTAEGLINQDGVTRVKNAVFAKAYEDESILAAFAEDTDSNIRNINTALLQSAPAYAKLNVAMAAGKRLPLGINKDIANAAKKLSALRQEGSTIKEYLGQSTLFDDGMSGVAKSLLQVFDQYKQAPKKIAGVLNGYVKVVDDIGDPNQGDLMGGQNPTRDEVLLTAINKMEKEYGQEKSTGLSLFDGPAAGAKPAEPAGAREPAKAEPRAVEKPKKELFKKEKPEDYKLSLDYDSRVIPANELKQADNTRRWKNQRIDEMMLPEDYIRSMYFINDAKKYLTNLNAILGWEKHTLSHQITPAESVDHGGEITGAFFKPGSKYGVYIKIGKTLTAKPDILWRTTTKDDVWGGMSNQWAAETVPVGKLAEKIKDNVDYYERNATEKSVETRVPVRINESVVLDVPAETLQDWWDNELGPDGRKGIMRKVSAIIPADTPWGKLGSNEREEIIKYYVPAKAPVAFGDRVITPEGKVGTMRGAGGIGSKRVKVHYDDGSTSFETRDNLKLDRDQKPPVASVEILDLKTPAKPAAKNDATWVIRKSGVPPIIIKETDLINWWDNKLTSSERLALLEKDEMTGGNVDAKWNDLPEGMQRWTSRQYYENNLKPKEKTTDSIPALVDLAGKTEDYNTLITQEVRDNPEMLDKVYDAIEGDLNKKVTDQIDYSLPLAEKMALAEKLENTIPKRLRTLEISSLANQQFSTPLTISTAAQHLAGVTPNDVVLEPTAGTGNLVSGIKNVAKEVIVNELSPRRAEVLKAIGHEPDSQDYMKGKYSADVIITNPPWGGAGRSGLARTAALPDLAANFINKNLRELKDGGRLVAVLPHTMHPGESSTAFGYLKNISEKYNVRAVIDSPTGAYKTRGTDVGSMIVVIDKTPPDAGEVVVGLSDPAKRGRFGSRANRATRFENYDKLFDKKHTTEHNIDGWDDYNNAVDQTVKAFPRAGVAEAKPAQKGDAIKTGDVIYHRSKDKIGERPGFDAYFGTKEFAETYKEDFGPNVSELKITDAVKEKMVDLRDGSELSNKVIRDLVSAQYPKDKTYANDVISGDKDAISDFYNDIWVDKSAVIPILKKNGLLGAKLGDEYLVTKEGIKQLKPTSTPAEAKPSAKAPIPDTAVKTSPPEDTPLPGQTSDRANENLTEKEQKPAEVSPELVSALRAQRESASNSKVFAPYTTRYRGAGQPHPRLVVETKALHSVTKPDLSGMKLSDSVKRANRMGWLSDEQAESVAAAEFAHQAGHGLMVADDVGVGKSREIAAIALNNLENGTASRVLVITNSKNNIYDLYRHFRTVAGGVGAENFPYQMRTLSTDFHGASTRHTKATMKKQAREHIPQMDKTIYFIDAANFTPFTDAIIQDIEPDLVLADECHKFLNSGAKRGMDWIRLHKYMEENDTRVAYFSATPGKEIDDLEYLYGLKEWAPGGFSRWISNITQGTKDNPLDVKVTKAELEDYAEEHGLTGAQMRGRDGDKAFSDILKIKEKENRSPFGKGRTRADFSYSVPPAEVEQILRELAVKGKMIARDLWREGVEFNTPEIPLNNAEKAKIARGVNFLRKVIESYNQWKNLDKTASMFGPHAAAQELVKGLYFDIRLNHAIEMAGESLKKGEQPVISLIRVKGEKGAELDADVLESGDQALIDAENDDITKGVPARLAAMIGNIPTEKMGRDPQTGKVYSEGIVDEAQAAVIALYEEAKTEWPAMKDPLQRIVDRFGQENISAITGRVSPEIRKTLMKEFQDGKRTVAVISGAGKTGISLHDKNDHRRRLLVTDYEWSPDSFKQELGRVDRAGQKSAPIVDVLHFGTGAERKFVGTLANRMKALGATSKGSAESTGTEGLSDFEIGGALDREAMTRTWRKMDIRLREYFSGRGFRDSQKNPVAALEDGAELAKFFRQLQNMPVDDGNEIMAIFDAEKKVLEREEAEVAIEKMHEEGIDTKSYEAELKKGVNFNVIFQKRHQQGTITRVTPLKPSLDLVEVQALDGSRYALLQGLVTPEMSKVASFLGGGTRKYITFSDTGTNSEASGLVIPKSSIDNLKKAYHFNVTDHHTPKTALADIQAGDKIKLANGWTLRLGFGGNKAGKIIIDGAKTKDLIQEIGGMKRTIAGSLMHSTGFFYLPEDKLQAFLKEFPIGAIRAAKPIKPFDANGKVNSEGRLHLEPALSEAGYFDPVLTARLLNPYTYIDIMDKVFFNLVGKNIEKALWTDGGGAVPPNVYNLKMFPEKLKDNIIPLYNVSERAQQSIENFYLWKRDQVDLANNLLKDLNKLSPEQMKTYKELTESGEWEYLAGQGGETELNNLSDLAARTQALMDPLYDYMVQVGLAGESRYTGRYFAHLYKALEGKKLSDYDRATIKKLYSLDEVQFDDLESRIENKEFDDTPMGRLAKDFVSIGSGKEGGEYHPSLGGNIGTISGRDYAKERKLQDERIQNLLGLIDDSPYPVAKRVSQLIADVSRARLFTSLADNPADTRDIKTARTAQAYKDILMENDLYAPGLNPEEYRDMLESVWSAHIKDQMDAAENKQVNSHQNKIEALSNKRDELTVKKNAAEERGQKIIVGRYQERINGLSKKIEALRKDSMGKTSDNSERYAAKLDRQKGLLEGPAWDRAAHFLGSDTYPTNVPDGWVIIDGKAWGPLNGFALKKNIYHEVRTLAEATEGLDQAAQDFYNNWKVGKIALNLPTVARNIISNIFFQVHMNSGLSPSDPLWIKVIMAMNPKSPQYTYLKDNGYLGSEWGAEEIREAIVEMRGKKDIRNIWGKVKNWAGDKYSKAEELGKMAVYVKKIDDGLSPMEAAKYAEYSLGNYRKVPPVVKQLRSGSARGPLGRVGPIASSPFISFKYLIPPRLAASAIRHPFTHLSYIAAALGVAALLRGKLMKLTGMSKDEANKEITRSVRYNLRHNKLALPVDVTMDDEGKPTIHSLDLTWIHPMGDVPEFVLRTADGNLVGGVSETMGLFNNPLSNMSNALITNTDPYTQQKITDALDNPLDVMRKQAFYAGRQLAPGMIGYNIPNLYRAMRGDVGSLGDKRKVSKELASLVGIKTVPYTQSMADMEYYIKYKDLQKAYYTRLKQLSRKHASDKEYFELDRKLIDEIAELEKIKQK